MTNMSLRINPEDTGSPTEKANLFKDGVFLGMLSRYTVKSLLLGFSFSSMACAGVFFTWKDALWVPGGVLWMALSTGAAFASFRDYLSRVKTLRINKELIPASLNNHFIKWFVGKR